MSRLEEKRSQKNNILGVAAKLNGSARTRKGIAQIARLCGVKRDTVRQVLKRARRRGSRGCRGKVAAVPHLQRRANLACVH